MESKYVVETFIKRVANMKQIETEQSSPLPNKRMKRPATNTPTKSQKLSPEAKLIKRSICK